LKSEVSRINAKGNVVVFDVDVVGGCNIKEMYGENALSIFIMPPSISTLKERLIKRATDKMEVIEARVEKASQEMTFAPKFDRIVVNDDLESTKGLMKKIVSEFIND
jgi:guanylate kinase